jgi:hypothetical protein
MADAGHPIGNIADGGDQGTQRPSGSGIWATGHPFMPRPRRTAPSDPEGTTPGIRIARGLAPIRGLPLKRHAQMLVETKPSNGVWGMYCFSSSRRI